MDIEATEKKGMTNIMKYFDRIHDKLFAFNNILIAGYFALTQLIVGVSSTIILFPIINMVILIFIDIRMMNTSRFFADIGNKNESDINENKSKLDSTNLLSLFSVITTFVVTLVFLFHLFYSPPKTVIDIVKTNKESINLNQTVTDNSIDSNTSINTDSSGTSPQPSK